MILGLVFTMTTLQNCGVDPLDGEDLVGKFPKSVCADTTLPDSNGDGLNDECSIQMGIDPLGTPDVDGDGIENGRDIPEEYLNSGNEDDANGQRRKNIDEISQAALLANSALNGRAPDGTSISVTAQSIFVVNAGQGLPTGPQAAIITSLCKDSNTPLTSYVYYDVVGTVKMCPATAGQTTCDGAGTPTRLELCGPLPAAQIADPASGTDIEISDFKWTAGRVPSLGTYDPRMLIKGAEQQSMKLVLTPSDSQTDSGNTFFNKLKVKFVKPFQVEGIISNPEYAEHPILLDMKENIVTQRNFRRTGTASDASFINMNKKMLGYFTAGQ